nr:nitroreductase family deazaflavin-dependent oxidoreductase [Microterricola viridarii]
MAAAQHRREDRCPARHRAHVHAGWPGSALVAGTSFARDKHPAWSYNLLARPDAAITVRGRRVPVHAELLGAAEREQAWQRIEAQWPGYRGYERESGRRVRLFRLRLQPGVARDPEA